MVLCRGLVRGTETELFPSDSKCAGISIAENDRRDGACSWKQPQAPKLFYSIPVMTPCTLRFKALPWAVSLLATGSS